MTNDDTVEGLRKAMVNLINAKLYDALATPGGLMRLVANRTTGVCSTDVRNAERQLVRALEQLVHDGGERGMEMAEAVRSSLPH